MDQLFKQGATAVLDDRSWLGSADGTEFTRSITLDLSTFDASHDYPDGFIPSGTPLGQITDSKKYGPYGGLSQEAQTFTISGSPTGGSFTITFSGQTTAAIPYNATAQQFQAALEGLSNVNAGDFVVVRSGSSPNYVYTVTAADDGQYADTNIAQMTSTDSLTGGTSPAVADATGTAGGAETATDGREVGKCFLFTAVRVASDDDLTIGRPAAGLFRGVIRTANLPNIIDAGFKTDVGDHFDYV